MKYKSKIRGGKNKGLVLVFNFSFMGSHLRRVSLLQEEKGIFCTIWEQWRSSSLVHCKVEVQLPSIIPVFSSNQWESFPCFSNVTKLGRGQSRVQKPGFNLLAGFFSLYHAAPSGSSWNSLKSVEEAGRTFPGLCFKSSYRSRKLMETGVTLLSGCVISEDHLTSLSLSFPNWNSTSLCLLKQRSFEGTVRKRCVI